MSGFKSHNKQLTGSAKFFVSNLAQIAGGENSWQFHPPNQIWVKSQLIFFSYAWWPLEGSDENFLEVKQARKRLIFFLAEAKQSYKTMNMSYTVTMTAWNQFVAVHGILVSTTEQACKVRREEIPDSAEIVQKARLGESLMPRQTAK